MGHKDVGLFQGQLGTYQVIETKDGSRTLRSPHFQEACHSLDGAYAETLHNYIKPNQVENYWDHHNVCELNILEVGLGLGVGVQVTYDAVSEGLKENHSLNYLALELDEALIEYARENIKLEHQNLPSLQELERYEQNSIIYYQAKRAQSSLTILIGDARESLPKFIQAKLCPSFQVIYQDPFSPRKNPSLWTREWFELLASTSAQGASLSTYCASVSPRKAMLEAGFRPQRLKGMGFKREITQAILNAENAQDESLERSLIRSKAKTLVDKDIIEYAHRS